MISLLTRTLPDPRARRKSVTTQPPSPGGQAVDGPDGGAGERTYRDAQDGSPAEIAPAAHWPGADGEVAAAGEGEAGGAVAAVGEVDGQDVRAEVNPGGRVGDAPRLRRRLPVGLPGDERRGEVGAAVVRQIR